jgi:hypothetical protein
MRRAEVTRFSKKIVKKEQRKSPRRNPPWSTTKYTSCCSYGINNARCEQLMEAALAQRRPRRLPLTHCPVLPPTNACLPAHTIRLACCDDGAAAALADPLNTWRTTPHSSLSILLHIIPPARCLTARRPSASGSPAESLSVSASPHPRCEHFVGKSSRSFLWKHRSTVHASVLILAMDVDEWRQTQPAGAVQFIATRNWIPSREDLPFLIKSLQLVKS